MAIKARPASVRRGVPGLFAVALCAACAGGNGLPESGDPSAGRVTVGPEPVVDGPVSIRFAIEPSTDVTGPVYVLLHGEDNQPGWVRALRGRDRIYFRERCEIEDCANPGFVCGASMPMVLDVTSTASRTIEFVWDGTTSVVDASGCETRQPAPDGAYTARFCYAREADAAVGGDPAEPRPGQLVDPVCTEMSFVLTDREVVLRM